MDNQNSEEKNKSIKELLKKNIEEIEKFQKNSTDFREFFENNNFIFGPTDTKAIRSSNSILTCIDNTNYYIEETKKILKNKLKNK